MIDAVAWPGPRALLQGLWIVAALVVLATALDLLRVRVLPRRAFGPWGRAVVRLWLIASCLSFLAMTAVGSLAWRSRPAMAALPVAQWARVEPARHTVFRYAACLAGGLPFLAAVYGATAGRLRYRVVTVDVPMPHLPPGLDGLRIVHLSDIHIGDFMPRAAIRRAVDMSNAVQPDLAVLTGDLISTEHDPLEDCITELSRLRAPLGVWGCHGNHERWAGVEARATGALCALRHAYAAAAVCGTVLVRWPLQCDRCRRPTRTRPPGRTVLPTARHRRAGPARHPQHPALAQPRYLSAGRSDWASSSALPATRMAVKYASSSGTASGARPVSSRRLRWACIACRSALRRIPHAMRPRHALRNRPSCM